MITYQDFQKLRLADEKNAVLRAINEWKCGEIYKTAIVADTYDRQRNDTIMTYVKKMFTLSGLEIQDFTASNNKIASNFFRRLNVQRNTYSLGNGVSFAKSGVKERFGEKFDTELMRAAYNALIHGVSFPYLNGRLYTFKATEFVPLWDEDTGVLMSGVRFWQIDNDKPMYAVLYENDGYTKYKRENGKDFTMVAEKRSYVLTVQHTEADGTEIVDAYGYSALPIAPLWGSTLKQSTLVGMRSQIDSYDLIRSGFANDLSDVSQIYWIVENYGGMSDADLARFRDRMKLNHIVEADTSEGGKITPYAQDIPFQARQTYLDGIRQSLYEDFGAFDVRAMSAAAKTATEIESAYQPLDENADDYEAQIIECVQTLGAIIGIPEEDATPLFKRNRVSNQIEQVEMLAMEAEWLDEETILKKLPNVTVDEVAEILARKDAEDLGRLTGGTLDSNNGNNEE